MQESMREIGQLHTMATTYGSRRHCLRQRTPRIRKRLHWHWLEVAKQRHLVSSSKQHSNKRYISLGFF